MALLVLTGALSAWLLPIALERLIDGDEGYLLMAARLISEGHRPYRDFFLPQGPLVPALFGFFFWGAGRSWLRARLLAGALAVVMGLLVYRETLSATRRQAAALFAVALFALSESTIGWLTIVKGFGLSALLMLASAILVGNLARQTPTGPYPRKEAVAAAAAGLALGLSAGARLYAVLVMPALALYLVRWSGDMRTAIRRLGWYALGFLLGLLPLIACYASARWAFVFDTFLYHGVREYGQDSLFGSARQKLPGVLKAMGLDSEASYGERQWMASAILATLALWLRIRLRGSVRSAAAWIWPILIAASLLPNPFLAQYLCLPIPFMAIEAGCFLHGLLDVRFSQKIRPWPILVAAAAVIYLGYHAWVGGYQRDRFLVSGAKVPGIMEADRAPRWQVTTVEQVARAIDTQKIPVGASWWPGYFVSTRTSIAIELANDFGFRAADALSREDRRRIHVVSQAEVGKMIKRRDPRLFVDGNWSCQPWASWLPENGYQVQETIENVRLWTAKQESSAPQPTESEP